MNYNSSIFRQVFFLVAISLIAISTLFAKNINIPLTGSVKPIILWKTGEHEVNQNDYVLFKYDHALLPRPMWLTKKIGCMTGQYLVRRNRHFFCNDLLIAIALEVDSQNHMLPFFTYDGVIPEGKAFVVGDTDQSFDSRYWGFISLSDAERVKPII
ncbi:S26 family signal peptidase [Pectobacterium versatile]|uniref:S26 family signal peptidase n=1 Tax=Pectobacterium versatile TaxID=2488639 RepID=UPI001F2D76A3|nr:S26 family signal peptidase [Pectobacterium versatile]